MHDHFSYSEPACRTTDQVRLAAGFGEALERLRVELDEPIYLNSACGRRQTGQGRDNIIPYMFSQMSQGGQFL